MASKVPVRYAKIDADGNLCDPLAETDLQIAFGGPFASPQLCTVTLRKIGSTVHAQFGICPLDGDLLKDLEQSPWLYKGLIIPTK